jgi:hypothetical protein
LTRLSTVAAAHSQFAQAERAAGTTARGAFGVGDEAFTYPAGIKARVGASILTLSASPSPTTSSLETAALTVVKML